ncbi:MAG: hypothetical protein LBO03_08700 [Acidaminococcales bacterium]|jgi:hypothetical protein|nr:hypothetical protein [Acidaminococcales bacterium]
MGTIGEIEDRLKTVCAELDGILRDLQDMKPKPANEQAQMYDRIKKVAANKPICNRQLAQTDGKTRTLYFKCLAALAFSCDASPAEPQLEFLARLAAGSDYAPGLDGILEMGANITPFDSASLTDGLPDIQEDNLRCSLLLEAIYLANLPGAASKEALSYIADLAQLLGCAEDDLLVVASLAKAVLQDDYAAFEGIPCQRAYGGLAHLLPGGWLERGRRKIEIASIEELLALSNKKDVFYYKICKEIKTKIFPIKRGWLRQEIEGKTALAQTDFCTKGESLFCGYESYAYRYGKKAEIFKAEKGCWCVLCAIQDSYVNTIFTATPFDREDDFFQWVTQVVLKLDY